jgi:adenine deaminase
MGTINAAELYRIDHLVGSIAPGRIADLVFLSDLPTFQVEQVISSGKLVAKNGELLETVDPVDYPDSFFNTMRLNQPITEDQIYLRVGSNKKNISAMAIELKQIEKVYRRHRREIILPVNQGKVLPDIPNDVLYISVTDRHSGDGTTKSAFITGFKLKRGAIATSLSPDDNNIICIGASVKDMAIAINHLFTIGGGHVVVDDGLVVADIALPICGVMANTSARHMATMERALNKAAHNLGCKFDRPFFRILFLSITGSPGYSVTDQGLIDNAKRMAISPILED